MNTGVLASFFPIVLRQISEIKVPGVDWRPYWNDAGIETHKSSGLPLYLLSEFISLGSSEAGKILEIISNLLLPFPTGGITETQKQT